MSLKKGGKDISLLKKIPVKLATKDITDNGTYKAIDDGLDGYSEVNVETSGVDINDYFNQVSTGTDFNNNAYFLIKKLPAIDLSGATSMGLFCYEWKNLEEISPLDTSNITMFYNAFYNCYNFMGENGTGEITLDIGKATNIVQIFDYCYKIQKVTLLNSEKAKFDSLNGTFNGCRELLDLSAIYCNNVERFSSVFGFCYKLTNFGGLINAGMAYSTTASENYNDYTLDLYYSDLLTHDSLMNVINGLYDIKTKGCNAQSLVLGSTNLAKLTAAEIAIATNKGWTVS